MHEEHARRSGRRGPAALEGAGCGLRLGVHRKRAKNSIGPALSHESKGLVERDPIGTSLVKSTLGEDGEQVR